MHCTEQTLYTLILGAETGQSRHNLVWILSGIMSLRRILRRLREALTRLCKDTLKGIYFFDGKKITACSCGTLWWQNLYFRIRTVSFFVHSVTLLMNSSLDLQGAGVLLPCSSAPPERFGAPTGPAWLWCLNVQRTPVRARLWEVSTASHSHWSWAGCAHDPSVPVSLPVRWNNMTTNNFIKHSLSHEIHTMMYRERTNSSLLTKKCLHSIQQISQLEMKLPWMCDFQLITQDVPNQRLITGIITIWHNA